MSSLNEFHPSLAEIEIYMKDERNQDRNMVPVYCSMVADLETPVSAFLKLRSGHYSFLLESVSFEGTSSRYSFIGSSPVKVIHTGKEFGNDRDPLEYLQEEMDKYRILQINDRLLPPFTGGAVGYCSYDAVRHFEPKIAPLIDQQTDVLGIPESMYMFYDLIVVFDHAYHNLQVVAHCRLDTGDLDSAYQLAVENIRNVCERLRTPLSEEQNLKGTFNDSTPINWNCVSNVGENGYKEFVNTLKTHISSGDIIQAVPSQRMALKLPQHVAPFDLYRNLRSINPSPYMFYLEMGENLQIAGASPEMLVKVDKNRVVETHPIAGTRPRGRTVSEDEKFAKDLLADEKECAEHIMLVDLGRNDIGRVAKPGTVKVNSLMHIEKYSHVMHIVSVVTGDLDDSKTSYDAYRAVFPAGTVSGAPKVRAMELVTGLERERRGIYSGSVGYFSFTGELDTAIAIRTIVIKDGSAFLQAGGGIVYDSDPQSEYEETMNKLGATLRTLERAIHPNSGINVG